MNFVCFLDLKNLDYVFFFFIFCFSNLAKNGFFPAESRLESACGKLATAANC